MKKMLNYLGFHQEARSKIFMVMKLSIFLLLTCLVTANATLYSQRKVTINVKNEQFGEVLKEVEKQAEVRFFFQREQINTTRNVSLRVENEQLDVVLDKLLDEQKLNYRILEDDVVVLLPVQSSVMNQASEGKAQAQKNTITGKVTDVNGDPIPGVNVFEKDNPSNGVITGIEGSYAISMENADGILSFSFIGYENQDITVAGREVINITLVEETRGLDEVVVTALGMKRDKKALGYAMQQLSAEELNTTSDPSINSALQGKVAGVQIDGGAGGVGSSTKITIRGNSSIRRSNEPLWIVDGVPINDESNGEAGEFGGVDRAGAAQDINPENIESISVLKGANASALYGSRAANGVILITTKSGKNRKGIGVTYNSSFIVDKIHDLNEFQSKYGQGKGGVFDEGTLMSWGPEMKGQMIPNYTGGPDYAMKNNDGKIEDFYQTGFSHLHNFGIEGGNEKLRTRVNIGYNDLESISRKHDVKKYDFSARISGDLNDFISMDAKVNYIRNISENQPGTGIYGSYYNLIRTPPSIRTQELEQYKDADGLHQHYTNPDANVANPYFILNKGENEQRKNRIIGNASVTFNLAQNLKLKLTQGLDFYDISAESSNFGDERLDHDQKYFSSKRDFREDNTEALLSFNREFGDIYISLSGGANRMYTRREETNLESGRLAFEDAFFIGNGTNQKITSILSEKEVHSVYGLAQFAYKNRWFVDVTGRNDWSSTLNKDNRSYFYPSFTTSVILNECFNLPKAITFAKLRAGYSIVGNDTDPYMLTAAYKTRSRFPGGNVGLVQPKSKPIPNLKPEETNSMEFGFDLKMFENRLGLDFTYYNASTENQILDIQTTWSSTWQNQRINAGEITNKGYEVMLYATPIKTNDLRVDLTLNWSKNKSEVKRMHNHLKNHDMGGMSIASVRAIEGHEFGEIWGRKYMRDENGNRMIDENGLPVVEGEQGIIGNITPDWIGSIRTDINYKNFSLGAQINIKSGGNIVSLTEALMAETGTAKVTQDRKMFVVDGVLYDDPTVRNNKQISTEAYYGHVSGRNGVAEEFLYEASYVKLQELSLGYRLPSSLLSKTKVIQSAKFSVVGRNLGYLSKDAPGNPEGYRTRTIGGQVADFAGVPFARTYGFNLSLTF